MLNCRLDRPQSSPPTVVQRTGVRTRQAIIAAVALLAVTISHRGAHLLADGKAGKRKPQSAGRAEPGEKSVAQLTALVRESVVVVSFAGRDGKRLALGSGFIISADGLIATNLHVIGEARPITVQTADGRRYPVTSIHASEKSLDLAVIKIDAKNLKPLPLGDSSTIKQGQRIMALGNPRGLTFSVVAGVVSGRRVIDGKPTFQLAIPIEPGNSGGPMIDMQGRVHGILTLKSLVTRDLGFAVRINALKPLLKKPNPIPMSRWLTIGALDKREWTPLFGATWRQRAGRIHVRGRGTGFGGRALILSRGKLPKLPFEVAVSVRLNDEAGAAGLVFHADGNNKHYGFYPTNGKLRLSRFEGPDVFSWKVLQEVRSRHYRPKEWNTLKVRVEKGRIQCFVNDFRVIDSTDNVFESGRVGLAKFRDTIAVFKGFRMAKSIPPSRPTDALKKRITKLVLGISTARPPRQSLIDALIPNNRGTRTVLRDRARNLERQAKRLRQLARIVHETKTRQELVAALSEKRKSGPDLLRAALLIARIDNEEVDVDASLKQVDRIAAEIRKRFKPKSSEAERLKTLDQILFRELGFHGSRTEYYSRSNSYLNEVIDDREGLPITISVLYMELARRLGLKVVGVGLPGHFIVRFEPKKGKGVLIDPFDGGKRWTRADAVRQVEAALNRKFDEQDLVAATPKAIIDRMLRNLMGVARKGNDAETMLRYVETVVALDPTAGLDRWFRTVLYFQTDRLAEAREETDWLLKHRPAQVDLSRVRQLRKILDSAKTQ
ncbi:MAG: trypsin-like peptidase domain-containing protein [Planctomycetes bacterium]|nr:trypsin-like peptidase domain-containing protein [Planctomycetota bacterium]